MLEEEKILRELTQINAQRPCCARIEKTYRKSPTQKEVLA